jgi:hypothetical protein
MLVLTHTHQTPTYKRHIGAEGRLVHAIATAEAPGATESADAGAEAGDRVLSGTAGERGRIGQLTNAPRQQNPLAPNTSNDGAAEPVYRNVDRSQYGQYQPDRPPAPEPSPFTSPKEWTYARPDWKQNLANAARALAIPFLPLWALTVAPLWIGGKYAIDKWIRKKPDTTLLGTAKDVIKTPVEWLKGAYNTTVAIPRMIGVGIGKTLNVGYEKLLHPALYVLKKVFVNKATKGAGNVVVDLAKRARDLAFKIPHYAMNKPVPTLIAGALIADFFTSQAFYNAGISIFQGLGTLLQNLATRIAGGGGWY